MTDPRSPQTCSPITAGQVRGLLAAALRGEAAPWPTPTSPGAEEQAFDLVRFHGLAGLLAGQADALKAWPGGLRERIRDQARAQAMWELRHRQVLADLLATLAERGVKAVLLKGSAAAYDLYDEPAMRTRGDTDLLVDRSQAEAATEVLRQSAFVRQPDPDGLPDDLGLQQNWLRRTEGGGDHEIDLHWQVLNAPALTRVLPVAECIATARPLPRLGPAAMALDPCRFLLHTCLHRALHGNVAYFIASTPWFGEDRLIWSWDLRLAAERMPAEDWQRLVAMAAASRVAGPCREALAAARDDVAAPVSPDVLEALGKAAKHDLPYLRTTGRLSRALLDLGTVHGVADRVRYALGRLLPAAGTMRARYPDLGRVPLPLLYVRRVADTLRRRTAGR